MNKRLWGFPSVAAAWLACGLPSHAQQPAVLEPPSTIRLGFEAAWARQPELRASALRRDAAEEGVRATERWTPEPPALELITKTDRFMRNDGAREIEATLAVPLWLPGERSRAQAAASAEVAAVDARLLAAQWRLAAEVREAYWEVQRARLDQELAQQRLASARQLAGDVARRASAGDLARSDSHQAEAAVATADGALAEASVALSRAAQRWTAVTGTAPGDATGASPEATPADLALHARHPALLELEARSEVARRQHDLAGRQKWTNPELTLGTAQERGAAGERYSQGVVVGLRIPLGNRGTSASRLAMADADRQEAEALLLLERERLRTGMEAARVRVDALGAAASAAQRRAALASESRRFFEKSFRLGETDLPTRLRVELEAFEAERQAVRSQVEHAAAVSQLRQALGLLPD